MKKNSPISSIANERGRDQHSLHSSTYRTASGGSRTQTTQTQPLIPPHELANMYTRQFAMTKTAAVPSIYQAAASAATSTANQTYVHGLTVLQSARSRGLVDPHVYRDWLIFEERLKQSYRRLQRKKRNYLVQIIAFGVLALYFAWFGVFGTQNYRFTCKLLSAGSAYCIYLIVTNRRFLQSIKYPAQCNRALHQFRIRFEANPLNVSSTPFIADVHADTAGAPTSSLAATASKDNLASVSSTTAPPPTKLPSFLSESQLSFFPTVPRQLRDGYLEFKTTYYRKRDAAKKQMQERMRREKQRRNSHSNPSFKTNERRHRHSRLQNKLHDGLRHQRSTHSATSGASSVSTIPDNGGGTADVGGIGGVLSSVLSGIDSATDDGSTTSSSIVSRKLTSPTTARRTGSNLIYTLPEQDTSSDSDAPK
ncbi:hypothetical protein GGI07_003621 [Coemansia sp. Benny D115]|nr:hypothetical protein GGI07_003621 [Coemansia sp. Benny D115]